MNPNELLLAARWYTIKLGLHIFPLVPGEKFPAVNNWEKAATNDPQQIHQWWTANPNYNIGIACGPSGLVVLDFDTYKNGVSTDMLFDDDDILECPIVTTPHGGTHVYFKQPEGLQLRNHRGDLPNGIDVRGHGGYVVAPPSRIESGSYAFATGHRPNEVEGETLKGTPLVLITAARAEREPAPLREDGSLEADEIRRALSYIPEQPGYDVWLSVLMAVHSVFPDDTGVALCEEWSPGYKGEIRKKFTSFTRNESGVKLGTLLHYAAKHGYRPPMPDNDTMTRTRNALVQVETWLGTSEAVLHLKQHKQASRIVVAPLLNMLMKLVAMGIDRGTTRVYVTMSGLANDLSVARGSVHRQLERLQGLGMVNIQESDKGTGTVVDLSPLFYVVDIQEAEAQPNPDRFYQEHIGDDAFATYPLAYANKRRGLPEGDTSLLPSLGPTGLLLWGHLKTGGTAKDIAEASGFKTPTVKKAIEKFLACGLVVIEKVGKENYYALIPEAAERLDEVRPTMQSAWVGQLRVARNHASTADYAAFRLRQLRRSKMDVSAEIRWWTGLRDDSIKWAEIAFDFLQSQGYDARCNVGKEREVKRVRSRVDYGEEWRTWGRPLFDNYMALEGKSHEDRVRLLALAGQPADWKAAYRETRERCDLMLMMSRKRVEYERRPVDEVPDVRQVGELQPTLF